MTTKQVKNHRGYPVFLLCAGGIVSTHISPYRSCKPFVSYSLCFVRYTQGLSIPGRKQNSLLARAHKLKHSGNFQNVLICAGAGNRTRTQSLARTSSTIKPRPQIDYRYYTQKNKKENLFCYQTLPYLFSLVVFITTITTIDAIPTIKTVKIDFHIT